MKVLYGLPEQPAYPKGTVVAIGNFDGLHLGHQRILRLLIDKSREMNLASLVLTFSPHPERVLSGGRIGMIQTLEQRLGGIRAFGVDSVVIVSFNRTFASLTAAEFAGRIIASRLKARAVVIGENFRFGKSRQGDVHDLQRLGHELGFAVSPVASAVRNGEVVSSSSVRRLLDEGRVSTANSLLGHPYEIAGRVIRGSGRGRFLGFPTANIQPFNEILPRGVFLTLADILGRTHFSLTNIGDRPTFGEGRLHVEVHIFDLEGTLYRRRVRLRFLRRIRNERKFADQPGLISQIRKDIATARSFFNKRGTALAAASHHTDD